MYNTMTSSPLLLPKEIGYMIGDSGYDDHSFSIRIEYKEREDLSWYVQYKEDITYPYRQTRANTLL